MKEMERLAIKKIDRISFERDTKEFESLSDEWKKQYYEMVGDDVIDTVRKNTFLYHVDMYYEDNKCNHEFGISNNNECICLDCGKRLDESVVKHVFYLYSNEDVDSVRDNYIKFLMNNSVCDSFLNLKRRYNIK